MRVDCSPPSRGHRSARRRNFGVPVPQVDVFDKSLQLMVGAQGQVGTRLQHRREAQFADTRVPQRTSTISESICVSIENQMSSEHFWKEELELFYELAPFDTRLTEVVSVQKKPLIFAEGDWSHQLVFFDRSRSFAGIAVLRTCNVRCFVKHHRTYIQKKRKECFREKQCQIHASRGMHHRSPKICDAQLGVDKKMLDGRSVG